MKRTIATVAALASCLALNAAAQTSAAPEAAPTTSAPSGPAKIAIVVFQQAVAQTNDFQRRFADLQKKYDPKRQQIQTLNTEIASLQKELQAQSATLSDAQRATKAKQLDDSKKSSSAPAKTHKVTSSRTCSKPLPQSPAKSPKPSTPTLRNTDTRWCLMAAISRSLSCSMPTNRRTSPKL